MSVSFWAFARRTVCLLAVCLAASAAAQAAGDYGKCRQAGNAFAEVTALVMLCAVPTDDMPDELVRAAGNVGETLQQCRQQLGEVDWERLGSDLETDFRKYGEDITREGSTARRQFCENGRDRLHGVLREFVDTRP